MGEAGDPTDQGEDSQPADESSGKAGPGRGSGVMSSLKRFYRNPAYRFVFFFLLYLGIIAVAYPPIRERAIHLVDALATATAWIQYHFFALFTDRVTHSDKVVVYEGFAVKIIEECTGIYEVLIFTAAVLAFPTSWAKKSIGLGMGVPLLYLFNVVRIALLIAVGRYLPEFFDFVHLYFMQATLILMITSVWLLWIIKVVKNERPLPAGSG